MGYQASLFDAPPAPVLRAGSDWTIGLLSGSLAVSLCVIAIAILGMLLLTGRLPLRRGLQVIFGCFLMLGASFLTTATIQAIHSTGASPVDAPMPYSNSPDEELPPADYNPYARASLRKN